MSPQFYYTYNNIRFTATGAIFSLPAVITSRGIRKFYSTKGSPGIVGTLCCLTGAKSRPLLASTSSSFIVSLLSSLLSGPLQCCISFCWLPPPPSSIALDWRQLGGTLGLALAVPTPDRSRSLSLGILGLGGSLGPFWSPTLPPEGCFGRLLSSTMPASGPWSPQFVGCEC